MSFAFPWLLLSLLTLPLVVLVYVVIDRRRRRRVNDWMRPEMIPNLVEARTQRLRHLPPLLVLLGLTFLLVGFARPVQSLGTLKGAAPVVVLDFDVSGSMAATDLGTTRVAVARSLASALIRGLPASDRVAVVSFGDLVQLRASPTFIRGAALAALPRSIAPLAGTRIGDGINEGVSVAIEAGGKGYPGDPQRPGVVVLFSDGGQTGGGPTPAAAANTAYLDGIPVDAVAIGTSHGTVSQSTRVLDQTVVNTFDVPVFLPSMEQVARASGGTFVAVDSPAALERATGKLGALASALAPTALPGQRTRDLSSGTAIIALACLLLAVLLSSYWFGRVM